MADMNKMNRTWLCSVVFTDIVNYSSQSVELQIRWKERFNGYLGAAIKDVPDDERVILDTGDGAAICFLGAPEAAMFTALELWHSLLIDERDQQPSMRVRIGINLGPVKLVRDINGAANAIGDGMNAGQRVMSFAGENQILVSQSYFEVVSRLSDDYKNLFSLKGVETDKHIREHTVYHLSPPGAQHGPVAVQPPPQQQSMPSPAAAVPQPVASPQKVVPAASQSVPENKPRRSLSIPLLVGVIVLVLVAAGAAWQFSRSAVAAKPTVSSSPSPAAAPVAAAPVAAAPVAASQAAPSAPPSVPTRSPSGQTPVVASGTVRTKTALAATPVASTAEQAPAPPRAVTPPARAAEEISKADQATARDLRDRYNMDASRAATARSNADAMRQSLAAKGMSLNAQTSAAVDNMKILLDQASEALRERRWDDALSSLQAVEAQTQKVAQAVGN